ncbi:hypothetical protein ABT255_48125 [Streptomyces mirabilis]|uniref:hypothetical protein n=1 Tax=Streptomyces mirabilis TaxID=68239 RepID=UPI00331BD00C
MRTELHSYGRNLLFQASGTAGGGLSSSWTWAAVFTGVGIVIGVYFTVVHRRRDKLAKLLEPVDLLLDDTAVALDELTTVPVVKDDLKKLGELCSRIEQAEKAFPSIPFGTVVATIEAYEKTVLPNDFAKKLTKKETADEILDLSRQQGIRIAAVQTAIDTVQGIIKPLRKR